MLSSPPTISLLCSSATPQSTSSRMSKCSTSTRYCLPNARRHPHCGYVFTLPVNLPSTAYTPFTSSIELAPSPSSPPAHALTVRAMHLRLKMVRACTELSPSRPCHSTRNPSACICKERMWPHQLRHPKPPAFLVATWLQCPKAGSSFAQDPITVEESAQFVVMLLQSMKTHTEPSRWLTC